MSASESSALRGKAHTVPTLGDWIWLFPLGYGVHLAEELWWGGGFPRWISGVAGVTMTVERFIGLNAVFFVAMLVSLVVARWWKPAVIVVLGTVVGVNALLHLGGSLVSLSYSPGAVSSAAVWVPLMIGSLRWGRRHLSRSTCVAAVTLGVLAHTAVLLLAAPGRGS